MRDRISLAGTLGGMFRKALKSVFLRIFGLPSQVSAPLLQNR
jgi:hypothetical protein